MRVEEDAVEEKPHEAEDRNTRVRSPRFGRKLRNRTSVQRPMTSLHFIHHELFEIGKNIKNSLHTARSRSYQKEFSESFAKHYVEICEKKVAESVKKE